MYKRQIQNIVDIIEKYKDRNTRTKIESSVDPAEFHDGGQKIIDHLLGLLYWTRDNGFHVEKDKVFSQNGNIDWRSTIRSSLAIHQNDNVIYVDPVISKERTYLSEVGFSQAYAILDLADKIGADLLSIWVDLDDSLFQRCREIVENHQGNIHRSKISHTILDFYADAKKDEDRILSSYLYKWDRQDYGIGRNVSVYGFCAFHTIWEEICLLMFDKWSEALIHKNIACQPTYDLKDGIVRVSPQIPDLLIQIDADIYLGDAKWYVLDDNKLPQLHDVVKQLFYELSIQSEFQVSSNFFIFPSVKDIDFESAGLLEMLYGENHDPRMPQIQLLAIGWDLAVENYLGNIDPDTLKLKFKRLMSKST